MTDNVNVVVGSLDSQNEKLVRVDLHFPSYGCSFRVVGDVLVNLNTKEVQYNSILDGIVSKRVYYYWDNKSKNRRIDYVENLVCAEALHLAGLDDMVFKCEVTGFYGLKSEAVELDDGRICFENLAITYDDELYLCSDCAFHTFRDDDGKQNSFYAPVSFWEGLFLCPHCGSYVREENYNTTSDRCNFCKYHDIIESYGTSHNHNEAPVFFGGDEKSHNSKDFKGIGFELEVDDPNEGLSRYHHEKTAGDLIESCGLENKEVRFAYDGSLNNGFEIISEPHTISAFWEKTPQWEKMLEYCRRRGYVSHDAGTCGLHVHVSRRFFGKTRIEQERAITKIFTFFDENWGNLCTASRRDNFEYCDKNYKDDSLEYSRNESNYSKWKKNAKYQSGHYVALNNGNPHTFEFRLGRGTLNKLAFFSWIDLITVIASNAKRITIEKVCSNDCISWLAGIKESTARYLYKRGAFIEACRTLFPSLAWESDFSDNN